MYRNRALYIVHGMRLGQGRSCDGKSRAKMSSDVSGAGGLSGRHLMSASANRKGAHLLAQMCSRMSYDAR